jgi:hypothetical protein
MINLERQINTIGYFSVFSENLNDAEVYTPFLEYLSQDYFQQLFTDHTNQWVWCFNSVDIWKRILEQQNPNFTYLPVWMSFQNTTQSGDELYDAQKMLLVNNNFTNSSLLIDVAGFHFDYKYPEIPVAIGSLDYIVQTFNRIYSNKIQKCVQFSLTWY